jgi:hypothetical protein
MHTLPQSRQNDLIVQELKDEVLVYDLTINKAYCLNPTSALVYQLCDGKHSVSDISKEISKKLKQSVTEDLVWLALDQFKEDNLLSNSKEIEIKFGGLSRREVVRKIGFASMVALPVISSLVAPTAAMAQSAGSGCVASGNTASGASTTGVSACFSDATSKCCSRMSSNPRSSTCTNIGQNCTCTVTCA